MGESNNEQRNRTYKNNLDCLYTSAKSTPNRVSSAAEVTSNIHVAGLFPDFIFRTPSIAYVTYLP